MDLTYTTSRCVRVLTSNGYNLTTFPFTFVRSECSSDSSSDINAPSKNNISVDCT